MWYLVGLIWIALMAGIVWSYRRKQAGINAKRAQQFDLLLADLKSNPLKPGGKPSMGAGTASANFAPAPAYTRKPSPFSTPVALLYKIFRAGLRDHELFINVPLADIVIPAAPNAAGAAAARMPDKRVDLIVCTAQLEIVAVVLLKEAQGSAASGAPLDPVAECLRDAGLRVVLIERAALPRHHQVRQLIYGAS